MPTEPHILILCIGNLLLLDEGFGPRVAEALLAGYELPPSVSVLDRGVMGMAILADLRGVGRLLVIDALDGTGEPPGTILGFKPEELAGGPAFRGAHDIRLADVLAAAALIGLEPEVDCLGVQVGQIPSDVCQIGLTPAVEAALPQMVGLALAWLASQGIAAVPRRAG